MNRSWHRLAAAALALLLSAAPAAAITSADRDPQDVGGTRSGWLTVLAGWLRDLVGDHGSDGTRPAARAASDGVSPESPPPATAGEPPANSESDSGPDWDPGG